MHAAKRQAQRRAEAQAAARQLQITPHSESHALSAMDGTTVNTELRQLETLRRGLNETITDNAMTTAGLDEWERTVFQHGKTTPDRVPSVLLADLSADLVEL